MDMKLLGVVAVASALIACGDSGSGGSGGGTGGSTGGGDVGGGGGGVGGGNGGGVNGGGGAGGGTTCEDQFPDGYLLVAELTLQSCGCAVDSPCETECMDDDVCTTPGPEASTDACADCVQAEGDMGAASACVAAAALGAECTADPDCSDYVNCVLAGG